MARKLQLVHHYLWLLDIFCSSAHSWMCHPWASTQMLTCGSCSHVSLSGILHLPISLRGHLHHAERLTAWRNWTWQPDDLNGWFRLVHRANWTIMDIRVLHLPGICIWVFCNLTLLQRDASAPPVIYRSIKPVLYYNLIQWPLDQAKAMSVFCSFSKRLPLLYPAGLARFISAINCGNTFKTTQYYQVDCNTVYYLENHKIW